MALPVLFARWWKKSARVFNSSNCWVLAIALTIPTQSHTSSNVWIRKLFSSPLLMLTCFINVFVFTMKLKGKPDYYWGGSSAWYFCASAHWLCISLALPLPFSKCSGATIVFRWLQSGGRCSTWKWRSSTTIRSVPLRSVILFRSFICSTTVTSLVLIVPWQDRHFVLVFLQYVSHLAFTGPWSTRAFLAGGLISSFSLTTKHNGDLRPDKIKNKNMPKQKGAFRPKIIKDKKNPLSARSSAHWAR